jgi:hypothetical protein
MRAISRHCSHNSALKVDKGVANQLGNRARRARDYAGDGAKERRSASRSWSALASQNRARWGRRRPPQIAGWYPRPAVTTSSRHR